ncbi:transcriptional regulator [Gluconacetobacter azotocaptans]|uniref:Transcriptional regulator n=1 Tax=Gluconacetobacter azotocaptans TaxID=142834 RepID=A0A7W4PF39_9PROT|nr:transcriptional regulator [Gluconacetobacter azotocaptans]MBB2191997.1 transcriptional regulator [Gluconacetobacter azotocaptans]GBQ34112.1 hypothetical protein AA13594_2805 [Gluconacetobacter azotocaptans DSM 13594]
MLGDRLAGRAISGAPYRQHRLADAFALIGWGVCQAERRSGIARGRITRWLKGDPADRAFLDWIGQLAALHGRLASPLSPAVTTDSNRPPLGPYEITLARLTIGWSERQLAERSGEHRTTLRRLAAGGMTGDRKIGRWLELLADGHRTWPRPHPDQLEDYPVATDQPNRCL